jgi:hypothetical protein
MMEAGGRPAVVVGSQEVDVLRSVLSVSVLALSSAPALAGVITVDDSGGADFTDLPAAVAAAESGDTLLVQPGTYSSFILEGKPLTVLGLASGQVQVLGSTRVRDLSAGTLAVLCQLDLERLSLSDNAGAVVLDGVRVFGEGAAILRLSGSDDVRAIAAHVETVHPAHWLVGSSNSGTLVEGGTRFEASESLIAGNTLANQFQFGWHALRVRGEGRAYLAASSVKGGQGGNERGCLFVCCPGYEGGYGVLIEEAGSLHAMGQATDLIKGGFRGYPWCGGGSHQSCAVYVDGTGAGAVVSGVTMEPSGFCTSAGGTGSLVLPPLPWLERGSTPQVGGTLLLQVRGEPGDVVTLFLGRSAVVAALPGVEIEQLTSEERSFDLGAIDASGLVGFSMPLPPLWSQGFTFFGQARILRGGAELRTNSTPIVLR